MDTSKPKDAAEALDVRTGSAGSLALELAHPESMLRRTLTLQAARLRALAATMEEEGKCLKILGITEKRIPNAFSRGAEMCGAADMARDWAANLEALLPNTTITDAEAIPCENCGKPAVRLTEDGVNLCRGCYALCPEDTPNKVI